MFKYCKIIFPSLKNFVAWFFFVVFWFLPFTESFLEDNFSYSKGLAFAENKINEPFSIVVLPDTQTFHDHLSHIFESQTNWILDNAVEKNILFVLHLGDIVMLNRVSQWETARESINVLDGVVPYALALGNHDLGGPPWFGRDSTLFNEYFPLSSYNELSSFGGAFEENKLDNVYHFFRANGTHYLVMVLEPAPRDEVLSWANKIVSKYSSHKTTVITHAYLGPSSRRLGAGDAFNLRYEYSYELDDTFNDGEEIWQKFVSQHKNIQFIFSGHIGATEKGKWISTGIHGNKVFEMASNYQHYRVGRSGFLRLLEFSPDGTKVTVKSYSPYWDEYLTEFDNQFGIDLDKGKFFKLSK